MSLFRVVLSCLRWYLSLLECLVREGRRHSALDYQRLFARPKPVAAPHPWDHGDYVSIRPEA